MVIFLLKGFVVTVLLGLGALPAFSQPAVPPVFLTQVVTGVNLPVSITHAGDGSGRLFIVEQTGQIKIFQNGALLPSPFLNITDRVLSGGERGLLSVAFPPGFAQNGGHFYVNYTDLPNGNTVVARYFVTIGNPDLADPATEEVLLRVTQPFANHNGGQLAFGPDGFLYIALGDGGSAGDPFNNAQNLVRAPNDVGNQFFLGKILRIDVESGVQPYAIPLSNPTLNGTQSEIWAYGLRNPWRFSFDRLTGDLYIGDVGQNLFEEINFQAANNPGGENYGWRLMEGLHCFNPPFNCDNGTLTPPVHEYDHSLGECSVTGGYVYRGAGFPALQGVYFYGDLCTGRIWGLRRNGAGVWQNQALLDGSFQITTFGEDEAGELYVADYANGLIFRIGSLTISERMGIYRGGSWFPDGNGNGAWDGCAPGQPDLCLGPFGGLPEDLPVTGVWTAAGPPGIGIYRSGSWFLDRNANGRWDGCGTTPDTDICFPSFGGSPGDLPVAGDWGGGTGISKIGIYRDGSWFLDGDGNGTWDGCGPGQPDLCLGPFGGLPGDLPVAGVWTAAGPPGIGIYRSGSWFLDGNGNGQWDGCGPGQPDLCLGPFGGLPGDLPVAGDWDGNGISKIGIYRSGSWFFDLNGSGVWEGCGGVDVCLPAFGGLAEDLPFVLRP